MVRRSPVKSTEGEIRRLGDALSKAGLLTDRNYAYTYQLGRNTVCVAWNNFGIPRFADFGTIDEYMHLLTNRQYTYLLFDGSLIQLVYYFRNRRVVQHHLGFYSPPVSLQQKELDLYLEHGLTLDDLLNDKIASDNFASDLRLKSPIRFDFDVENNREDHPASHLHLSESHCRIAVFAPLSIGHFVRFVFRHFYPDCWKEYDFIRRWPYIAYGETIMAEHKKHLYVGCAR
jgi:hypothetical protein